MPGRILCLLALPVLGSAGIIVQNGGNGSFIEPFPFEPYRLNAVEATLSANAFWDVGYEFAGMDGVSLNPPAKITTRGYGGGDLNFPGGASFFTPEFVCEFPISETASMGSVSCGGSAVSPDKWAGDPTNPLWFEFPIYAGDAHGGANASCVQGLPDIACFVTPGHVYAGVGYELTYYYDSDYPPNHIPEPGTATLVLLPLAAGALAVRASGASQNPLLTRKAGLIR